MKSNRFFRMLVAALAIAGAGPVCAAGLVVADDFDDGPVRGTRGRGLALHGEEARTYDLNPAIDDRFTMAAWVNVGEYPDGGAGTYDEQSPMVVMDLSRAGGHRLMLRLHQRRMQLAFQHEGVWASLQGATELEPGEWHHLAAVRDGAELRLYVDGRLDGIGSPPIDSNRWQHFAVGGMHRGKQRFFRGKVDEVRLFTGAMDESGVAALAEQTYVLQEALPPAAPVSDDWMSFGRYDAVRVGEDVLHPLIDQLSVNVTVAPWTRPGSRDLLISPIHRRFFGARMSLFTPVGTDHRDLPIYDTGEAIGGLTGTHFAAVTRPDGLFNLFAGGDGTPFGQNNVIQYVNRGRPGAPTFAPPQPVRIDGRLFDKAIDGELCGWSFNDLDGDGTPDLIVAVGDRKFPYRPDPGSAYSGELRDNSGKGRGYDIEGNWLGGPMISKLHWAKGRYDSDGTLTLGELKLIHYRLPRFGVQWVSTASERAMATIERDGQRYLIHTGNVDRIYAMPLTLRDGEVFCGEAVPLLRTGPGIRETYIITSITPCDLDGDGREELLLDGNPGRCVVLRGDAVGQWEETGSLLMKGGYLAVDTLAVPCRVDWDGDGKSDLIVGDASGYLSLWPGTDDPLVYGAPVYLKSAGELIHHQAGMTGSIQGPSERRWGYLNPAVGDWDSDGEPEIITNNIAGELFYYDRGDDPTDLAAPRRLTLHDGPLPAAWRVRPQMVPWRGGTAQLFADWDGDLALASPQSPGSVTIAEVTKLRYADGRPVVVSGPVSAWGRVKLSAADWDGDGDWDVLLGTNRACYKFITDAPPPFSTPMWLKNEGDNDEPRFAAPRLITLGDELIDFGVHVASVCATDLDGDGRLDLLIGGEDGKVYHFHRDELKW